jgi:release factor glutamine methyltransferase
MPFLSHLARDAARQFQEAGIPPDESRLDAVLLARHVLGWDLATWIVHDGDPAPEDFTLRFGALAARRAAREPMAYILGRAEFWGLEFEITPAVLVPRPETEIVIEEILARAGPDASWRIADVGTGSGCLAVSIAHQRPSARVVATDLSTAALGLAARNAAAHAVGDRIDFVACSLLGGVTGQFDLIASNPPYVRDGDGSALQPEVRDFEPALALYGGEDGLAVIRALVAHAKARLKPEGWLIFEFGFGQDQAVRSLLEDEAWSSVNLRNDLQGVPRTAVARRSWVMSYELL